ncbi:MAG: hypothetical protein LC128_13925 [Chitinophagales bacterium]|nr:hypothetical protein [Chitinophagales bacterium]
MNRRNFIRKSGALSIAIAGLPLARKISNQNFPVAYESKKNSELPDQYEYNIEIFHEAIKDFPNASPADKQLKLYCFYYKEPKQDVATDYLHYEFTIASVTKAPKEDAVYIIKTTKSTKKSGELAWPQELPANPVFKVSMNEYAKLLNKKGEVFIEMKYKTTIDDDMDCFITTACVTERGLADDCEELTTLRYLRANYMSKTEQGKKLLDEYQTLGPDVVTAIANCENRNEIYDYLYQHMITPAVKMIKNKEYQNAVDWYQGFAEQLKKNYC